MLIAIFFISCSSDAPSLVGKWQMKKSEVDEKQKIESTWYMDLKADNTLSMAIEMLLEGESDGFSMKLPMSLAFDGKWNSTDKVIVISADTTTTKFAIDKEKMDFKFTNKEMEAFNDKIKKTVLEQMEQSFKDDMMKQFLGKDSADYVLNGDKLQFITKSDTLDFQRVKN